MRCNRLGCNKEATHHEKVPIGDGLVADAWFCDKHYKEGIASIKGDKEGEAEQQQKNCYVGVVPE